MKLFFTKTLIAASLLTFMSLAAHADPIPVTPTDVGSSVEIDINSGICFRCSADTEFSDAVEGEETNYMEVGDTWVFDFFSIFVNGLGVVDNFTIEATLAFLNPVGSSSSSGEGGFGTFFGLISGGWLTWANVGEIELADGSWLTVQFEDVHVAGLGNSTTVSARVSRHGAVSVPEPGVLALLGFGLLFLWLTQPRRRAISHD